jgi:hypothetical protein
MKQADVKVGDVVLTLVCGTPVKVRVTAVLEGMHRLDSRSKVRYHVERLDNGKALPKSRTAAALRPCPTAKVTKTEVCGVLADGQVMTVRDVK